MDSNISVVLVYILAVIFAALSGLFLKGKGKKLFVGHDTTIEPRFCTAKLSKVVGICFAIITVFYYLRH